MGITFLWDEFVFLGGALPIHGGWGWALTGERERAWVGCSGLPMCMGSAGMPCWDVKDLVCRRAGRLAGSVALHRNVSPLLAGLIFVRRIPRSVELHWVAVDVRGLVHFWQILMPIRRS